MTGWRGSQSSLHGALVFASVLAAGASLAAAQEAPAATHQSRKPPSTGSAAGYGVKLGGFFDEKSKDAAKKAFAQHFAKAKTCPQDMERKGKTCRALVQGHYWAVGQPLRKDIETFPLPENVLESLPKPPEGYEYVRAGEDILLVSKGLRLVVDMMQDVLG